MVQRGDAGESDGGDELVTDDRVVVCSAGADVDHAGDGLARDVYRAGRCGAGCCGGLDCVIAVHSNSATNCQLVQSGNNWLGRFWLLVHGAPYVIALSIAGRLLCTSVIRTEFRTEDLADGIAFRIAGGGRVYFPTDLGFIILQVLPKAKPQLFYSLRGRGD